MVGVAAGELSAVGLCAVSRGGNADARAVFVYKNDTVRLTIAFETAHCNGAFTAIEVELCRHIVAELAGA